MGVSRWSDGIDRRRRLARALADSERHSSGAACGVEGARVIRRLLVLCVLSWGLVSLGFIWCVVGRECDYQWACFSATFFNVTTQ